MPFLSKNCVFAVVVRMNNNNKKKKLSPSDKCPVCGEGESQNQVMISCDGCVKWFHNNCQKLSKQDAIVIAKCEGKGVKWFCQSCYPAIKLIKPDDSKTTDQKLDLIALSIKDLNDKIANPVNIQSEKAEKPYYEALMKNFEKNIDDINKSVKDNKENIKASQNILQQTLDQNDAEARKVNAILYGIPETNNKKTVDELKEFMRHDIFIRSPEPISAFRLGARRDRQQPRPIKIKFNDEESKWEFIKRVGGKFRDENIHCKLDTPKALRDKEFILRQELKKLRNDNETTNYRIRDMQIQVQQAETGNWVVLRPVAVPASAQSKETTC